MRKTLIALFVAGIAAVSLGAEAKDKEKFGPVISFPATDISCPAGYTLYVDKMQVVPGAIRMTNNSETRKYLKEGWLYCRAEKTGEIENIEILFKQENQP